MQIKLKRDIPVEPRHGLVAGRVMAVVGEEREKPRLKISSSGRLIGWWVNGDDGEKVLVQKHEAAAV